MIPFGTRHHSLRTFYMFRGSLTCSFLRADPILKSSTIYVERNINNNITFKLVSSSYGSLYMSSSMSLIRLLGAMFFLSGSVVPIASFQLSKAISIQTYKTRLFQNAYLLSSEIKQGISKGLNVTYLIQLLLNLSISTNIQHAPSGIGIMLSGRIQGRGGSRTTNGLCVGSFSGRILDLAYETYVSSLGCVGIKVGITI